MSTTPPVDVAVVGCGVIGASVAWRLAQLGLTVRCLDPTPGDGATHAAAGMLAAVTEAEFGDHELTSMNVESARLWTSFDEELQAATGHTTGMRRSGTLTVAFDISDRDQLRRLLQLRHHWGLDSEEITTADARGLEPLLGPRLSGATWTPGDHQVNPRLVQNALLAALQVRGVSVIRQHVSKLAFDDSGDGRVTGVVDDTGLVHHAGAVVLAAGWRTGDLVREGGDVTVPTRPVKGQIARLDARQRPEFGMRRVVRGFVQSRPIYLVPRDDGEIVVGATSEEQPDDRQVTAGGTFALLRDARALVPGIDELPLADLTSRARPGTPDNLPLIGESGRSGLLLATGHYRNGVLLAPLTAAAIAAQVCEGRTPASVTAADPRRFGVLATTSTTGRLG